MTGFRFWLFRAWFALALMWSGLAGCAADQMAEGRQPGAAPDLASPSVTVQGLATSASPVASGSTLPAASETPSEPFTAATPPPPPASASPPPPSSSTSSPPAPPLSSPSPLVNTAVPTALPCWQAGGRIETGRLPSKQLPTPLEYRLYLPPCYDQQTERRYPSLYLIHGQSFNDDQWDRLGADAAADALIGAGEVAPFIILMPRDRVWTSPKEDRFGQALVEELIPWVDANYRTRPERASRAIGGLSRGGGWALHLGLQHWQLFGAIGGHSLAIFKSDLPYYINLWLDAIPPDELPRLYMDIGDHDLSEIRRSAGEFEKLLTKRGIPHEWHVYIGYHDEQYWGAHVTEYLRWYAAGW